MANSSGALDVAIHPLVLINISDHYTRMRHIKEPQRVIGILLGKQDGRKVEVCNSFEMSYTLTTDPSSSSSSQTILSLDKDYLAAKTDLYKRTFAQYEILGWYSSGFEILPGDIEIHKQISEINENPLYLLLDVRVVAGHSDLPLLLFESEIVVEKDTPTMRFAKTGYKIETEESERISVEQVSHLHTGPSSSTAASLGEHLNGMISAVSMLNERIDLILTALIAMKDGSISADHELLREIHSLVHYLPAIDSAAFKANFENEYNDTLLLAFLSAVTKGTNTINDLVDKYNMAYEKHGRRRAL